MIVKCKTCTMYFDDEFRETECPHSAFLANDGQNNFNHYFESWLNDHPPKRGFYCPSFCAGGLSEHDQYLKWLEKNKVRNGPK